MTNKFEQRNDTPEPVLLTETPQVGNSYCLVKTKEQLKEIVELPLLDACEELYDKNIRTIASSANKNDIAFGQAHIMIDFDTLSEENKTIARKFATPEQNSHWGGGQILMLTIPVSASSTIKEISQQALAIANEFNWQPAVWIPKHTPESFAADLDEIKERYYLDSPEYDDPNSAAWQRQGYYYDQDNKLLCLLDRLESYYDPETETYYPSEELFKKANQKSDPRKPPLAKTIKISDRTQHIHRTETAKQVTPEELQVFLYRPDIDLPASRRDISKVDNLQWLNRILSNVTRIPPEIMAALKRELQKKAP